MPAAHTDCVYVDGAWRAAGGGTAIDVVDSWTERRIGSVAAADGGDVDAAVQAARRALPGWAAASAGERAGCVLRLRDGLARRADELAELVTRETGMPVGLSRTVQVGMPLANLTEAATTATGYAFDETIGTSLVVREPIGVVGAITPWNYPLHQIVCKLGYAVAAGCTVVLKPSEIAPLDAFVLAEVVHEIGLPPGVVNLVAGAGADAGAALAGHAELDMVSFTGSTAAGRRVAELAGRNLTKVALELGGKSANILLDDLSEPDFDDAVTHGVRTVLINSGQSCSAPTRLLVPHRRLAHAVDVAADAMAATPVGDPFDPAVAVGPLASGAQRERVLGYVRRGIDEGARLVTGGLDRPAGLDTGFFVRPTLFADVTPDMTVAREEIFGPVLVVIGYRDDDDAVAIADDVAYGLSGAVSAGDPDRARRVALRLRTGQVNVNGATASLATPRGGFKQSGFGRECGRHGFEEFLGIKSIQFASATG